MRPEILTGRGVWIATSDQHAARHEFPPRIECEVTSCPQHTYRCNTTTNTYVHVKPTRPSHKGAAGREIPTHNPSTPEHVHARTGVRTVCADPRRTQTSTENAVACNQTSRTRTINTINTLQLVKHQQLLAFAFIHSY